MRTVIFLFSLDLLQDLLYDLLMGILYCAVLMLPNEASMPSNVHKDDCVVKSEPVYLDRTVRVFLFMIFLFGKEARTWFVKSWMFRQLTPFQ